MKVLAVDWGGRRLGFAASDESGTIAFPLDVVECRSGREKIEAARSKVIETGADLLVVGLPLTLGGVEGESAREVRRFAASLGRSCSVPIILWDERMTSGLARKASMEMRHGRRSEKKERVDAVAASILLQSYLDKIKIEGGTR